MGNVECITNSKADEHDDKTRDNQSFAALTNDLIENLGVDPQPSSPKSPKIKQTKQTKQKKKMKLVKSSTVNFNHIEKNKTLRRKKVSSPKKMFSTPYEKKGDITELLVAEFAQRKRELRDKLSAKTIKLHRKNCRNISECDFSQG
ncbi:unnamed protein product [Moneuplotes crassus]|uniref:Uncharacterized protein n=1 Tax=Euplotes crassus TaxID=5936 RepID=A0AAD1XB23_EUPCR|nr:unnamed protein product [Moneuplotes crassus]